MLGLSCLEGAVVPAERNRQRGLRVLRQVQTSLDEIMARIAAGLSKKDCFKGL